MIEHIIEQRSKHEWCVVAKGRGVASDTVVATHYDHAAALEHMHKLNAVQFGRKPSTTVFADDHKRGCTCQSGGMLLEAVEPKPCPVHG